MGLIGHGSDPRLLGIHELLLLLHKTDDFIVRCSVWRLSNTSDAAVGLVLIAQVVPVDRCFADYFFTQ